MLSLEISSNCQKNPQKTRNKDGFGFAFGNKDGFAIKCRLLTTNAVIFSNHILYQILY